MLNELLHQTFLGNKLIDYIIAAAVFVAGLLAVYFIKKIIFTHLAKLTGKTSTETDDFILKICRKTFIPLAYYGVLYIALRSLELQQGLRKTMNVIGIGLVTFLGILFVTTVTEYLLRNYWINKEKDVAKENAYQGVLPAIKVVIWIIGIIFLLDNLGFEISAVVAGLGIGGAAVALGSQAILKDLFSYFAIIFDKPFEYGDFIIIGDFLGTIEHIGIKTTRIRSLGGEQLVFSNTDLTDSRLRNYKRMGRRRVVFKLGVVYQTQPDKLRKIPEIVKDIILSIEDTVFDRAHFSSYGDFSLIYEIVYYVIGSDYNRYMDIQQMINLAIKEKFTKEGIEFAYPTQTLFLSKTENG